MLCRYGETGFTAGFPVLSPATKGSVINTEHSGYCFCSIATIEVVANDLLFKCSRVFFLPIETQNPYSLDVQLSGFNSLKAVFCS